MVHQPVKAIHINWTLPAMTYNGCVCDRRYRVDDFELLSTILSALLWRRNNGPIKLYTDSIGYEYYLSLGLLPLWDEIDTKILDGIPNSIDAEIFWAAAKIFAVQAEKGPVVMMDTDLLVWKRLDELRDCEIAAFHTESLDLDCYLPYESLKKRTDYQLDKDWDWNLLPYNTALAYFDHPEFKKYYTDSAIDFMTNNKERPCELVSQMVFAEQRLFSMCARKLKLPVHTFLKETYNGVCDDFTHLWGAKGVARSDRNFNEQLCRSLVNAIRREFPRYQFPVQFKTAVDVSI